MKTAAVIFFISLSVFLLSGWNQFTRFHFFVPLAEAFLEGRLYVNEMAPELHEMISEEEVQSGEYIQVADGSTGKFYVIFPPLPAVLITPFVAVWGENTNQSYLSMVAASVGVVAAYFVFLELIKDRKHAIKLTVLYAFGSMLWYHAVIGSGWYFSQVCGLLFLWLAILATLKKQHLAVIGTLIGLAYLSRYSLLLSFPFFVYMTQDRWKSWTVKGLHQLGILCLSFGFFVGLSLLYNFVRYGQVGHYGYTLLEQRSYNLSNEYSQGSYSTEYLPRTLTALLWTFPKRTSENNQPATFPFVVPNSYAMALWFVFPAIFICFFADLRNRISQASWLGILCILPTMLFHGGVGTTQFGYRYALDVMPFLLLLIALATQKKFAVWQKLLFVLSILINLWGILFIQ